MNLMIVESPNKIKKIESALKSIGGSWRVEASVGHVRDLDDEAKEGDLVSGVSADLRPRYCPTERGRSVIAKLKKSIVQADKVYLATDPDREGEAISWHLAQALGLKQGDYVRVTFNEVTKSAIAKSLKNERSIDNRLVAAQEARRVLDRLVGFAVSPLVSNLLNAKASAGRVQSPAVGLVVERERAIRNFKPVDHYSVRLSFDGGWTADWDFKPLLKAKGVLTVSTDDDIEDQGEASGSVWQDKVFAQQVAKTSRVVVRGYVERVESRSPSGAFTTSSLQQAGGNVFGWSPKKVMEVAQKLFEGGLITYHRTDSPNLSDEAIHAIRLLAQSKNYPLPESPRRFREKGDAQGAHEAVRPTHFEDEVGEESDADGRKLYKLIWRQAVASQLADATYDARLVLLESTDALENGYKPIFRGKGSKLKTPGFRVLMGEEKDGDADLSNPIPKLIQDQVLSVLKADMSAKKTKPPVRFTMPLLVKKLENSGIGRPSTYASIMDNIMSRGYITEEKKKLIPSPLGEQLWDALNSAKFSFIEVSFTRSIESQLDLVSEGKANYGQTISAMWTQLGAEIAALPEAAKIRPSKAAKPSLPVPDDAITCPKCKQGKLIAKTGQYGQFWSCNAYPKCKTSCKDKDGKPDLETIK